MHISNTIQIGLSLLNPVFHRRSIQDCEAFSFRVKSNIKPTQTQYVIDACQRMTFLHALFNY